MLTANKRGATLVPLEGNVADAAREFEAQEASMAAEAAAGAGGAGEGAREDDRPLTGAKGPGPPGGDNADDRPLNSGGKGSLVPPSEFPPGHEEEAGQVGKDNVDGGGACEDSHPTAGKVEEDASGSQGGVYMTALG